MASTQKLIGNTSITALEQLPQGTSLGSAVTLATIKGSALNTAGNAAMLQAESQNLRVTFDGTAPVAGATGMILIAGQPPYWYVGDLSSVKVIEETSGGKLNCAVFNVT